MKVSRFIWVPASELTYLDYFDGIFNFGRSRLLDIITGTKATWKRDCSNRFMLLAHRIAKFLYLKR